MYHVLFQQPWSGGQEPITVEVSPRSEPIPGFKSTLRRQDSFNCLQQQLTVQEKSDQSSQGIADSAPEGNGLAAKRVASGPVN